MIGYDVLTHADVYLLLSIYTYELFRFLCEHENPPEPRNIIPNFLNRDDVASEIRSSGFSPFSRRRTPGSPAPLNLFETIVFYYADIKRDYKKRRKIYTQTDDPCFNFRVFSNYDRLKYGENLFNLEFTPDAKQTTKERLEDVKRRRKRDNNQSTIQELHKLMFKLTLQNLTQMT